MARVWRMVVDGRERAGASIQASLHPTKVRPRAVSGFSVLTTWLPLNATLSGEPLSECDRVRVRVVLPAE